MHVEQDLLGGLPAGRGPSCCGWAALRGPAVMQVPGVKGQAAFAVARLGSCSRCPCWGHQQPAQLLRSGASVRAARPGHREPRLQSALHGLGWCGPVNSWCPGLLSPRPGRGASES